MSDDDLLLDDKYIYGELINAYNSTIWSVPAQIRG